MDVWQVDGCIDEWVDWAGLNWTRDYKDEWMSGWMGGCMRACMGECMDGQQVGR